jgi:hypothetical protein
MTTLGRIHRIITDHNDIVDITLDGAPTPFPQLDAKEPGRYPATAQIHVRYGYGEEWVWKAFGRAPDETTDVRRTRRSKEDT